MRQLGHDTVANPRPLGMLCEPQKNVDRIATGDGITQMGDAGRIGPPISFRGIVKARADRKTFCSESEQRGAAVWVPFRGMRDMHIKLEQAHLLNEDQLIVCFNDGTTAVFHVTHLIAQAQHRIPSHEESDPTVV